MPRRRRTSSDDNTEARKKRVRSFRNKERREQRKKQSKDPMDLSWITSTGVRAAAVRIMNATHSSFWPYWLSIPHDKLAGTPPVSPFWPSKNTRTKDRVYYGFMIRDHRDELCLLWPNARKELTPDQ